MHLQSSIKVKQPIEKVLQFFYEPTSLAKWDRSVAEMIPISNDGTKEGATFQTIAPSGMKMDYEVIEMTNERDVKILLKNSKMFKKAIWQFQFDPTGDGTNVTCHIYFSLRPLYFFLYPVLFVTKKALLRDLNFFRDALTERFKNEE